MSREKKIKEYVEKIDSAKKVNPKDLSSDQDLTIGIMNLISIEEHLMFSGAKTGKTSYYDLIEQVREIRKQLMQKVILVHLQAPSFGLDAPDGSGNQTAEPRPQTGSLRAV